MNKIDKILDAIQKAITAINKNMATKDDINNMATKDDLKNLETRLIERIDDAQMEIIATVDRHKEDKNRVRVLEKRVERLEDNAGLPHT